MNYNIYIIFILSSFCFLFAEDCPTCEDDDTAVSPMNCVSASGTLGCDGMWGDTPISELCPMTCGTCPVEDCAGNCTCAADGTGCSAYEDSCSNCRAGIADGEAACSTSGGAYVACGAAENSPCGCDGLIRDCNLECGGDAIYDDCGVCDGGNADMDCAGECNGDAVEDCAGECNGALELDDCGVCDGGNADMDCAGECNGASELDDCGVCDGDNTSCSWTNLTAAVEEINQITISWDAVDSRSTRNNRSGRDCTGGVCLSIDNVDTDAGTLDIYMTNQAGCSYCTDPAYNNNTQDWVEQKGYCELGLENTWVAYDPITEAECAEIPGFQGDVGDPINGGWWFNGEVGGFQFELTGIDLTGSGSGGSAEAAGFAVQTVGIIVESETTLACPDPPCTFLSQALGFSMTGTVIPIDSDVLLTQISFSNYDNTNICFGENSTLNTISDASGGFVAADWGECACPPGLDECGVCGGSGISDGDCDCFGNIEDECGVCDGNNSSCEDCAGVLNGDAVYDQCGLQCVQNSDNPLIDCIEHCDNDSSNDCEMDCSGTWGGSLENDLCGICDGDGPQITCWDGAWMGPDGVEGTGDEFVCVPLECPINPDELSYKIYRNGLGIPIAQIQQTEYTDLDLDYNEPYCYTVTYVNDGLESHHSNQACAITGAMPIVEGCMSTYACNYNVGATVDDGSCWFVNTGCSCEAGQDAETDNCGVCDTDSANDCIPDCSGEWGGDAYEDECGVCGGDNSPSTGTCDCEGTPNGSAVEDCAGVCKGSAYVDQCSQCAGGNTGAMPCQRDCAGFWGGDLIGVGEFECVGEGDEDNDPSDHNNEDDCGEASFFWLQIGNDLCDICGGDDSSCEDDCGEPNGNCFGSGCEYCDGTNPSEDFIDCNTENTICEGDPDWSSDIGNGSWNSGEEYTDENNNGKYDAELCDECADCNLEANGIALMEIVDENWVDFWGVEPICCESGELDLCGVCDGPGAIYECGCVGLPKDDDSESPTFGNQACSCDGNVVEDDCGTCGGSNYFMLISQNMDLTGEYCEEGDGWVVNNETDVIESCVLVDEGNDILTNYCDCAETEANSCGLCISNEDAGGDDQECCEIYKDCAGVCYGDAIENPCGECYGGTLGECSLNWNNAADCEDELNGECTVSTWVDVLDTLGTELNTIGLCEDFSGDGINIIGECLIDSNWAAQWDHDGIDTTDTIVILNEADCIVGECSVSMWDFSGDGEEEDVTTEAECLSIFECVGYTGTAAISSSECTCLGYEWTQVGTWYNAEWFNSEWIVGEWTPFLENDLPECLEAECGSNEFECEDAGGEWYTGQCWGDAPKLGCDDICSNNPLEYDCNGDCGGPNGDGTDMLEWNECNDCVLPGDKNDVTCEAGCDIDENGDQIWTSSGECKAGECREAQCRAFDLEYLGEVLDYYTADDCEDNGGVWYGTNGEILSDNNKEDCENCSDANEDGNCDNEDEVIGIWYPEEGETLNEYENKPDCEDIEQGGGTWVSFALVEDDCGVCGGTDNLGESGTFEDANSDLYGQCSCVGVCIEERVTLDCEGSCGGSAEIYFNDYGADGLPATDELEADEGENDGEEEEFCCESGNYDCTDVCDGPLANICLGSDTNIANENQCTNAGWYWSVNGDDACGECGGDNIFVEGNPDILSGIYGCENFDLGDDETNEEPTTKGDCETLNGEWGLMNSQFEMLNAYGECDCTGSKLDCDGVCAGSNQSSDGCDEGGNGNYCSISHMDECGICYGEDIFDSDGLLPDGSCDCFGNIANCAGECPTIPNPENNGVWISNPDWKPISGTDNDGDGICDDEDDCVSNPLNNKHLFYKCDIVVNNGICPIENLSVVEEVDEEEKPNTNYGGYDVCGICNGNGFSCGFEVEGGVKEMKLTWRKPFSDEVDSSLVNNPLGRSNSNTMGSFESYSLFSSSGGNTDTDPVSLEIKNVNIDEGTLEIVLTSIPACSYCENPLYNNNAVDWQEKKQLCELQSTWIINTNITENECAEIPGFQDNNGGWWYDGHISGYQFTLTGITLSDATAPEGFMASSSESTTLGFSLSGATIPPGIGTLLTTISFDVTDDYAENGICFAENDCSTGACTMVISDQFGDTVSADWGKCHCPDDNPFDICGVCGGDGYAEGTCDCEGNTDEGCGCGEDGPAPDCWDNETEVCYLYECPPNPDAVSFNVYRENAVGDLVIETGGLIYNNYIHPVPGWEVAYTYAISYKYENQEYFITDNLTYEDNQNSENAVRILGVTDAEVPGCTYPSSCSYDGTNPANSPRDNECWWPTYACDCESPQYSVVDECGECDGDSSSCFDCAGQPNGDGYIDNCGDCVGGETGIIECVPDCSGEWGGVAVEDGCGVCEGDGTSCLSLYNGLIPDDYSIHNIYPNPFNPNANIVYGVPELSNVKVTVYDLHGRQIAVLQNDIQTPGYYAIQWDATQYSSGVYFIEMLSDDFRQIKQVLHMK